LASACGVVCPAIGGSGIGIATKLFSTAFFPAIAPLVAAAELLSAKSDRSSFGYLAHQPLSPMKPYPTGHNKSCSCWSVCY